MRYLSFLFLKMRYLRFFGLLAICLGVGLFSASNANAQRVTFGVGIGGPVYYGPAPVCTYGYYSYAPYDCAPYGYYGPDWFTGGVFLGAGPWFHGHDGFWGPVDHHFDGHHGYRGPFPHHGDRPDPSHSFDHMSHFGGTHMHDGFGHERA